MAQDIILDLYYALHLGDTRDTRTSSTMGTSNIGTSLLGEYSVESVTDGVLTTLVYNLYVANYPDMSTVWVDVNAIQYVQLRAYATVDIEIDAHKITRGLTTIPFQPWVFAASDSTAGRIHIPTDPYV